MNEKATFEKAHETDTGYDLTAIGYEEKANGLYMIDLGVKVEPPTGYYFEVVPRSSFSKTGLIMANSVGIIDQDYRGVWFMPVRVNDSFMIQEEIDSLFSSLMGIKIAQAKLHRLQLHQELEFVNDLSDTVRGIGGFGSTGKK